MNDYIRSIVEKYFSKYQKADFAAAGHNGPYMETESFVRNTAHWIISFSTMYALTNDIHYKEIVSRFSYSLLHEVEKSPNGAIFCIKKDTDPTNGLIGLAWVIEGLVEGYRVLGMPVFLDAAEKIYFSQLFDSRLHTWRVRDLNGTEHGVDIAFNHSLWFCMAAAKLVSQRRNDKIDKEILDYLAHVGNMFTIYKSGLISHFTVNSERRVWNFKMRLRKQICAVTRKGLPWKNWNHVEYERAYHLFSLYAFALLYQFYPQVSFFKSEKFRKLKAYGLDLDNFISFSDMNSYAYGYNSPAFELPLIQLIFGTRKDEEYAEQLLALHQKYNIALDGISYGPNVPDTLTLDARVYEIMQYYRLKEISHEQKG